MLAGERGFIELLDVLLREASLPELRIVRVSEFMEGVLLVLSPRVPGVEEV